MNIQLTLNTELNAIPSGTASQRVVELVVTAPKAPARTDRPRLNLALVIDRSGSMTGFPLEQAKQAAMHVLDLLQPQDRVSVVVYDDQVNVLCPASPAYPATLADYRQRIARLESGNMTALFGGWQAGALEVASNDGGDGWLNRVLLLTDGLANVGPTDPEIIGGHTHQLSMRGVSTSTFGLGEGYNEHLLERMANRGGGNFYYIASAGEIPAVFQAELNEVASVTARKVQLVVDLPGGVGAQVLGDFECAQAGQRWTVQLGDLNSGRQLPIYIKLLLPPANGSAALEVRAAVTAVGLEEAPLQAEAKLELAYGDDAQVRAMPINKPLMERFARVDIAQTTNEALKLERAGRRGEARDLLHRKAMESREYAPEPLFQNSIDTADRMMGGLEEWERKEQQFKSYNTRKQRGQ